MEPDDAYLLELKQGLPAAYERLVAEFEGPLYRFFYCDHRDHHLAQEQTAETFAQLVRSLPTMTGSGVQLPAFVFTVARRQNQRRFRRPKQRVMALDSASEVHDPHAGPSQVASDGEQLARALAAISQLDSGLREVLLLRFVEGYAIGDVAAALEMPMGTVKSHIHRGREQLRKLLSDRECEA